jgi:trimeric autotransporter adhesin
VVYDDGSGPAIFVQGSFTTIGGIPARHIAKWNGKQWSAVGSGLGMGGHTRIYDDGRGPALYVIGYGYEAGGVPVNNIARWDGVQWEDVGGGTGACAACPQVLYASAVFDDGTGPGLYVAGYMQQAGGVPARGIARWDGKSWSALGHGIGGGDAIMGMAVVDDPRGPSLFVAMTGSIGGSQKFGIAQWVGCPNCYANCDLSTTPPVLNIADFICFIQQFAAGEPYANCNVDAVIDIADFVCFVQKFAAGCGG